MRCPSPHCEGQLILTRTISSTLGMDGEVPEVDIEECEDYIVCAECGELPSYTWEVSEMSEARTGDRIVLMGEDVQ